MQRRLRRRAETVQPTDVVHHACQDRLHERLDTSDAMNLTAE